MVIANDGKGVKALMITFISISIYFFSWEYTYVCTYNETTDLVFSMESNM